MENVFILNNNIAFLMIELSNMQSKLSRLDSFNLNVEPIKKLIDMEQLQLNNLEAHKEDILRRLDAIEDKTLQKLLELRYVKQLQWIEIEESLNYSHAQVHRLHYIALAQYQSIASIV